MNLIKKYVISEVVNGLKKNGWNSFPTVEIYIDTQFDTEGDALTYLESQGIKYRNYKIEIIYIAQ